MAQSAPLPGPMRIDRLQSKRGVYAAHPDEVMIKRILPVARERSQRTPGGVACARKKSKKTDHFGALDWGRKHITNARLVVCAMLSIVIPIHNEEPSILPLYDRLAVVLESLRKPYEILFVDDASTDRSFELLSNLVETDPHLTVLRLRRNFGQTAALSAGFHQAGGDVIIAMDGDLQHAPEDIPLLLAKIEEGYDIASGWRKERVDNAVTRKIPSRIANWLMAKISGVELRDFGTTFKAYRAEVLQDVNLYGELHRFIPALASFYGARVAEVPIRSTPRASGDSHYGLSRTFRVLFDLLTIKFLLKYFTRPMHFFGALGLLGTSLGGVILGYLTLLKILGQEIVMAHGPLMIAGGLLLLAGLMMFSTGLLGEVMIRTYFESQDRRIYAVREIRTRKQSASVE